MREILMKSFTMLDSSVQLAWDVLWVFWEVVAGVGCYVLCTSKLM